MSDDEMNGLRRAQHVGLDDCAAINRALRESEQRFRLAMAAGKLGYWEVDVGPQCISTNEELYRNLGYEPGDLSTDFAAWAGLVHPDDLANASAAFDEHLRGKTARYRAEFRMRTKAGEWKWILSQGLATARDATGKPQRVVGVNIDIDERKAAEEAVRDSEERFRAAFEQAAVGIGHLSPDGEWMRINEKFARMLGYRREEMIGRHWTEFTHPDDLAFCEQLIATLLNNERDAFEAEKRWLRKDGTPLAAQMTVSTVRDARGDIRYFSAVCLDLTERRRAEAERQAREVAENANRAKSEFLANVSHELRSPLNTILGFARLLHRSELPEEARRDLGIIVRSGEHLLTLINQVLALSQIEAGRATLEASRFDLHKLLRDLRDMFARRAEERDLEFVVDCAQLPRFVEADQIKLRQVLINLLSNAVKFTRAGRIGLAVRPAAPGGALPLRRLRFAVSDTGPGMTADELKQLFGPFVQAEAGRQAGEGSGLGLAISRSFVHLMGGELEIESRPGRGTTVGFEIPVEATDEVPATPAAERPRALGPAPGEPRRRILVVDDLPEARELLVRLLQPLGFELKEAVDGHEAIAIASSWQPDLVWMDLAMPGLDGLEAIRRIKAGNPTPPTIIALTAHAFEEEWPELRAAGCDDLIHKPFHEGKLLSLLEKYLGAHFIYEESAADETPPAADAAALATLAALPEATRDELAEAVINLDTGAVDRSIQTIRTFDPRLAEGVAELAEGFQYDRILAYIRAAPQAGDGPS